MAVSSIKLKRISFRMSDSQAKRLEDRSVTQKISKATLITHCLESFLNSLTSRSIIELKHQQISTNVARKTITFNFYLDTEILNKIDKICLDNSINRSFLLTSIIGNMLSDTYISNKLNKKANEKEIHSIKELYRTGNYTALVANLNDTLDFNAFEEVILYIRSQQFLGNFKEAYSVTNDFECKTDNPLKLAELKLIKARIEIEFFRNVQTASDLIKESIELLKNNNSNNNLLGEMHYVLASIKFYTDEVYEARDMYEMSLKYLNPITSKELFIQSSINLARVYTCLLEAEKADNLFNKIESSIDVRFNHYHQLNISRARTVLAYINEDFKSARYHINEALKHNLTTRSNIEALNMCEESGKCFLFENQDRLAFTHDRFTAGMQIEKSVRPNVVYSRLKLFKHFVEARYKYSEAKDEIDKVLSQAKLPIQQNLTNYIKHTTMYIYGNENDKSQGELNLRILNDTSKSPLIKQASAKTLANKTISPIW